MCKLVMDRLKIQKAVRQILEAIGEDPKRHDLLDTPKRVAQMYEEIFSGIKGLSLAAIFSMSIY